MKQEQETGFPQHGVFDKETDFPQVGFLQEVLFSQKGIYMMKGWMIRLGKVWDRDGFTRRVLPARHLNFLQEEFFLVVPFLPSWGF